MQNIIVAFPKAEGGRKLKSILTQSGCHVPATVISGNQALARANELRYGTVLTVARLSDMTWMDLFANIPEGFSMVILLPESQMEAAEEALTDASSKRVTFVPLPFVVGDLLRAIREADARAEAIRRRDKSRPRTRSPEQEAVIRQAKNLLMETRHMTEAAAHRYLQRRSMESQISLFESAQKVIVMLKKDDF